MTIDQVACQLYTLRNHCRTAADFAETCRKLRAIGYRAVQVSGVAADIPDTEIVKACAGEGLAICAIHDGGQKILDDPRAVAARLHTLGAAIVGYPHPGGINVGDRAQLAELCRRLDAAGEALAAEGCTLVYHNHSLEFMHVEPGVTALEFIYQHTRPAFVQGEIDTYWVQHGGGDPIAWCHHLAGRLPILHLKDYVITAENKVAFCEVGSGNLDFPGIIEAAESSGCEWFAVEQDSCPGDPFDSVRESFEYIADVLCDD